MCPSRLPNETTSYGPKGMLDRDQRTARTINRTRDVVALSMDANKKIDGTIFDNNQQHQGNKHQFKSMMMIRFERTKDDLALESSRCKFTYNCQQQIPTASEILRKEKNLNRINCNNVRLVRKYYSTSGYSRSSTKLVNCLLIFICIWFAVIHRSCAYPLSQSAMLANEPNAQRCKMIRDALRDSQQHTKITSDYITALLENYTKSQFKKPPIEVHEVWRQHPAHFNYDMGMESLLPADFDEIPPASHYSRLSGEGAPTNEQLSNEIQRIYLCLHTLNKVFQKIIDYRKINETQIMQDFKDRETHEIINNFFTEQLHYNILDIAEIKAAMKALQIPFPEQGEVHIKPKERITAEWIITRENLKVHRYIEGLYKTFLERCSS